MNARYLTNEERIQLGMSILMQDKFSPSHINAVALIANEFDRVQAMIRHNTFILPGG